MTDSGILAPGKNNMGGDQINDVGSSGNKRSSHQKGATTRLDKVQVHLNTLKPNTNKYTAPNSEVSFRYR